MPCVSTRGCIVRCPLSTIRISGFTSLLKGPGATIDRVIGTGGLPVVRLHSPYGPGTHTNRG